MSERKKGMWRYPAHAVNCQDAKASQAATCGLPTFLACPQATAVCPWHEPPPTAEMPVFLPQTVREPL